MEEEHLLALLFTELNHPLFLPFSVSQQCGLSLLWWTNLWSIGDLQAGSVPGRGAPRRTPPGKNPWLQGHTPVLVLLDDSCGAITATPWPAVCSVESQKAEERCRVIPPKHPKTSSSLREKHGGVGCLSLKFHVNLVVFTFGRKNYMCIRLMETKGNISAFLLV